MGQTARGGHPWNTQKSQKHLIGSVAYRLYGLTDDEVKVVEKAAKK